MRPCLFARHLTEFCQLPKLCANNRPEKVYRKIRIIQEAIKGQLKLTVRGRNVETDGLGLFTIVQSTLVWLNCPVALESAILANVL